jgi:hypothetical protein
LPSEGEDLKKRKKEKEEEAFANSSPAPFFFPFQKNRKKGTSTRPLGQHVQVGRLA